MIQAFRQIPVILVALVLVVLVGATGQASAANNFAVTGVKVDATANSAAAAQGKAQDEGFRLALKALLDRHVMRADQPRLGDIDDRTLSSMIQSFQVQDEKRSGTRYLATMNVTFKETQFRNWVLGYGVPISESAPQPTLLIAAWAPKGSAPVLWDGVNPWHNVLEAREQSASDLIPLILPDGDLDDIQNLNARQAMSTDKPALAAITQKYGADRYVVAALRLLADKAIVSVLVDDPFGQRRWTEQYLRGDQDMDDDAFLMQVADAVRIDLDEDWKRRTLITDTSDGTMNLFIPIRGLRDWETVQQKLKATAGVRDVTILEVSRYQGLVRLDYQGGQTQLAVSLSVHGYRIATDLEGRYVLSRGAAPGQDRGSKAYPQ